MQRKTGKPREATKKRSREGFPERHNERHHQNRVEGGSILPFYDKSATSDTSEPGEQPLLQEELLHTVQQSSNQLSALIDQVLDLNRIEDGHLDLKVRTQNFSFPVCLSTAPMLCFQIKRRSRKMSPEVSFSTN